MGFLRACLPKEVRRRWSFIVVGFLRACLPKEVRRRWSFILADLIYIEPNPFVPAVTRAVIPTSLQSETQTEPKNFMEGQPKKKKKI
jgi:hypothetical protein